MIIVHISIPGDFGTPIPAALNGKGSEFVPFRCKSRFCPARGNKYCIDRSAMMSFKLIPVKASIDFNSLLETLENDLN